MFVALRDAWFARGRFAVMGLVVALVALLVVALSGLTAGLGAQSVSALRELPGDRVVVAEPAEGDSVELTRSQLSAEQVGDDQAHALGIATGRIDTGTGTETVSVFGVDPDGPLAAAAGDSLVSGATVGGSGTLEGVSPDDTHLSFNHMPVVWVPLDVWRELPMATGSEATALVVPGEGPTAAGTTSLSRSDALQAVGSYSSEQGSLQLIQGLLLVVSAVVVSAFLTVWTIQRTGDLAVMRALGATRRTLVGDVLTQGLLLLLVGGGVGALVATGLGAWVLATDAVPWALTPTTTVLPWLLLVAAGLVGAALAVRRVLTIDPALALEGTR
ncbi:FtsX-like permease family protein [Kytococcus sedentarius]|uniref:FtsX-like permease family protein n=1 Tax=Kytococcus sedentarius TaxID=1276 RepID=UPI0035BC3813